MSVSPPTPSGEATPIETIETIVSVLRAQRDIFALTATETAVLEAAEAALPRPLVGKVVRDGLTLSCSLCGSTDIREMDRAERWNRIEVSRYGGGLMITQRDPDFETVGVICGSCSQELDHPEDFFAVAEWYR